MKETVIESRKKMVRSFAFTLHVLVLQCYAFA